MIVEQIWTANNYRNFNYLIACPQTGEALAVDPLDHEKCLARAKRLLNSAFRSPRSRSLHRRSDDSSIWSHMPMIPSPIRRLSRCGRWPKKPRST